MPTLKRIFSAIVILTAAVGLVNLAVLIITDTSNLSGLMLFYIVLLFIGLLLTVFAEIDFFASIYHLITARKGDSGYLLKSVLSVIGIILNPPVMFLQLIIGQNLFMYLPEYMSMLYFHLLFLIPVVWFLKLFVNLLYEKD